MQTKKEQQKIQNIFAAKKIEVEYIDIASDPDGELQKKKKKMRELCGDTAALPPQICNNDTYCGV